MCRSFLLDPWTLTSNPSHRETMTNWFSRLSSVVTEVCVLTLLTSSTVVLLKKHLCLSRITRLRNTGVGREMSCLPSRIPDCHTDRQIKGFFRRDCNCPSLTPPRLGSRYPYPTLPSSATTVFPPVPRPPSRLSKLLFLGRFDLNDSFYVT